MKKNFAIKQLFHSMCAAGLLVLSSSASASAFQLWEQDAASVGDYHSGRAAQASDASTAWYNSAGIIRIPTQQLIVGDVGVLSDLKYTGTVLDNAVIPGFFGGPPLLIPLTPTGLPTNVVAQGGSFTQIPNLNYVAPITERLGFGFSVIAPFGLRTEWGQNTPLMYAGTNTTLKVVDFAPSLGFAITKKLSVGGGLDYDYMAAEFDNMTEGVGGPITNTYSTKKGNSWGWGYHLGVLYQFTPETRVGVSFNSEVHERLKGSSNFYGYLANLANGVPFTMPSSIYNSSTYANVTLPSFVTLSAFHQINDRWDIKATAIWTHWSVIQNIAIYNVSGAFVDPATFALTPSTGLTVSLPANYKNTWNYSIGGDFAATDKITLRAGVGYDQSPVLSAYRNIQVPDANRVAVAFGGHYQAWKAIGFDLGYTHLFMVGTASIQPPAASAGAFSVTTNGNVRGSADVFAGSVTWSIA